MVLLFALACLLAWLALFAHGRELLLSRARAGFRAAGGMFRRHSGFARRLFALRSHGRPRSRIADDIRNHRHLLLVALLVVALPPALVLVARREVVLDGFENVHRPVASVRIEELLRGERLVPPPPPPPEVFLTAEVEQARPMTATADRKWEQLDAGFTQRLLAIYQVMREQHGYEMVLVEGYRSSARQDQLAARGQHVTRARGGRSWHQYGLAADSAFMRDGKLVISERDPWAMRGYQLYGQVAKEAGLVWGGDWRSIKDLMHVELRREGVMQR